MTSQALKTPNSTKPNPTLFVAPLLNKIKKEGELEYAEMQETFQLMGWTNLPDELKFAIYDDVKFMVLELKGLYCSCDEYVQRRRESVHFWVQSYLDRICTLKTAVNALKIKSI